MKKDILLFYMAFLIVILPLFISGETYNSFGTYEAKNGDGFSYDWLNISSFFIGETNLYGDEMIKVVLFNAGSNQHALKEGERAWLTDNYDEGYKIRVTANNIQTENGGSATLKFQDATSNEVLKECENAGHSCMDMQCGADMEVMSEYDCNPPGGRPTPCCKFEANENFNSNPTYSSITGLGESSSKYFTLDKIDAYGDTKYEFKPDSGTFSTNIPHNILEALGDAYVEGEKISYVPRYSFGVEKIDITIIKIRHENFTIDDFLNYISGEAFKQNYLGTCKESSEKIIFTEVQEIIPYYRFYLDNSNNLCPGIKNHEFEVWISQDKLILMDLVFTGDIPVINTPNYYTLYLFAERYFAVYPSNILSLINPVCEFTGKRNQGNYCFNAPDYYYPQKELSRNCQNDYECQSNSCKNGVCAKSMLWIWISGGVAIVLIFILSFVGIMKLFRKNPEVQETNPVLVDENS